MIEDEVGAVVYFSRVRGVNNHRAVATVIGLFGRVRAAMF